MSAPESHQPRRPGRRRRWPVVAVLLVALVAVTACDDPRARAGRVRPSATPPAASGLPASMAALGDSVTAGLGSCLAFAACVRNSWATGSGVGSESHFTRIEAVNPAIRGRAFNFAVPGARVADLSRQANRAVRARAAYVTVLIGANDACRSRLADMTSVARFRAELDAALEILARGLPRARVLVVSIPDLYRLWQLGRTDRNAVRAWSTGICPALLANPTSTDRADGQRRQAFRDRIGDYNRQLAAACRAYRGPCRYDGGAAHRVRFTLDVVNRVDYFHPNLAGQNTLARVTFPRRFTW